MQLSILKDAEKYAKQVTRRRLWRRLVRVMACIVVFCTTYLLILPAITMEQKTFCGLEEHRHTSECYAEQAGGEASLLCDRIALSIHSHADQCYDSEGKLTCGTADFVVHTHNDLCRNAAGDLVCTLPEIGLHTHTENCYSAAQTQPEAHIHGEGCYETQRGELICQLEEIDGHTHGESCVENVLICELTDPTHTHDKSSCYQTEQVCQIPEREAHAHTDECYEMNETLICQQEEQAEPAEPARTEPELICGRQEIELHTHTDECFTANAQTGEKQKTCDKPEVFAHDHTESCLHTPEVKRELICELEEHTHGVGCYADPNADVETREQWEKTFSQVNLTGIWSEDVLSVAKTQLGYTESTINYDVREDGTLRGYTRYGQWYGNPREDWDAMFVSFCLHYAGVEKMPLHWESLLWTEELKQLDLYRPAGEYTPHSGDLIFFDYERDGVADRVGLIAEILYASGNVPARVKTIEGDCADSVCYADYDIHDPRILGYGELPENETAEFACGLQIHNHADGCYDASGSLICGLNEHIHDGGCQLRKIFYTDEKVRVFVTIRGVEDLPDELKLDVRPITRESDPNTHGAMQVALSEKMATKTEYVSDVMFYQMELLSGGTPYELPEDAKVSVSMTFTDPVFNPEAVAESTNMQSFMLTQDDEAPAQTLARDPDQTIDPSLSGSVGGEEVDAVQTFSAAPNAVSAAAAEESGDAEETKGFEIAPLSTADFENSEGGVTGLQFEADRLSTLALALASQTQTGTFWTRVTTTAELASGGTFMIVSAEGNYALTGNEDSNFVPVTLQTVKGNTQYYTISGSDSTNVRWNFSGSNSSYAIQNQGSSVYLYMDRVNVGNWIPRYENHLLYSKTKNLTLSYKTPQNCWRIANGSSYLQNKGTGAFSYSSSSDGSYGSTTYYYTRDMLIFKLSDVTSLTIPPDILSDTSIIGKPGVAVPKPDYGEFITPDAGKYGDTAVTSASDSTISVKGKYYSDPATSDIESEYRTNSYEESNLNDGKVLTDKSVIYGSDDYDAYSTYKPNTFSVTLSALGQAYEMPMEDIIVTPVDVVFVLDVSGSMTTNKVQNSTTEEGGRDASRAKAMTEAVNTAIAEIMNQHKANRVGIVLYSGGAWEMLPLDRYTATGSEYLVCEEETITHVPTNVEVNVHRLKGSSSLKNDEGVSFADAGDNAMQGIGTYTQAGIALGRELFHAVGDDITYTTTVGEGDDTRTYTVKRQPVMILLSDGEPTHSTNIFMDVLNGPHYGDGNGGTENALGIHGYNTILSANYYKRMMSYHYQKPALFYTVGMGINTEEEGDGPQVKGSQTGDNYKRAVLNPTVENITNLTSSLNASNTTEQLKSLMLGTYSNHAIKTRSNWPEKWMDVPHLYVPALQSNPYIDNYSYADEAFFGNLTGDDLKDIFADILKMSLRSVPYGFILHQNSAVELTDHIGVGMEVKSVPVLRYGGQNYSNPTITVEGNVTTYVYTGIYKDPYIPDCEMDISEIRVQIIQNSDGTQTVDMYVPDTTLPTYTPELNGKQYYYESLPVRLIYQVGLTEQAEQQVLNLQKTGGKLTFYTNKWNGSDYAVSTLIPSEDNTFYYDLPGDDKVPVYAPHHRDKEANTTSTLGYVVDCSKTIETFDNKAITKVVHKLGNNGKLEFEADSVKIPVEKKWDRVAEDAQVPVEITLYKVVETTTQSGAIDRAVTKIESKTLNSDNGWKATFEGLKAPEDSWYYVIAETHQEGFQVQYSGETVSISLENGAPVTAVKVSFNGSNGLLVTVTNLPAIILPATGGAGTSLYTMGGLVLMAAAGMILLYSRKARRRKEDYLPSR